MLAVYGFNLGLPAAVIVIVIIVVMVIVRRGGTRRQPEARLEASIGSRSGSGL
jgi:hypothetical protein